MIEDTKLNTLSFSTDFTFEMNFIDLDFIKNKLSSLKDDETAMFIFDKSVSYHPKYKKFRYSLFNLSHCLFTVINDDKNTAVAYTKKEVETISIFNKNELITKNTLEDIALNDFKLIGLTNDSKKFLATFKDLPSVLPQFFFYKVEHEQQFLNIQGITTPKNTKILQEDLEKLMGIDFLSFLQNEEFIVLGNNFNFKNSVHFIPIHDALLFDYIFLYFNSMFFKTFIKHYYGEFCTIDDEVLMNIPIPLLNYSEQTYYSWDRALFFETSKVDHTTWEDKIIAKDKNIFNNDYHLRRLDYFFDKIFDFLPH